MFCISCIPKLHRWGTLYFKLYTRCTTYHMLYALLAFPGCTNEALYTLASNRNALLPLSARGGQFIAFFDCMECKQFGSEASLLFKGRSRYFYIHTIGIACSCSGISRIGKNIVYHFPNKIFKNLFRIWLTRNLLVKPLTRVTIPIPDQPPWSFFKHITTSVPKRKFESECLD